jgi:dGTPase
MAEPAPAALRGFELDRHRIVHCTAFRRLEYKTQVYVIHEGDHYRTRLTHTLEVASQARRLAAGLSLDSVLAECIALAHDLGHPPFGHAGEAALAERMAGRGGFEHNLQSLRVVDYLEHPYPDVRGLNLTYEVREGLAKHRTRYDHPDAAADDPAARELLESGPMPTLEAQVANLADEIAYTLHDVEDGLLHEFIDEPTLGESRLWSEAAAGWRARHPALPTAALRRAVLDTMLDALIADAVRTTQARIADARPSCPDDVRRGPAPLVGFSEPLGRAVDELQRLLRRTVYTNERVQRMDREAAGLIRDLYDAYAADPSRLPERFAARIAQQGPHRVICDYVAGMTDRFCRAEHARLTTAPSRFI